jgi:hypothetical protein
MAAALDGLKPTTTDFYVFDIDLVGFGVRVRSTGGRSPRVAWCNAGCAR